jgi:hypothetical protein
MSRLCLAGSASSQSLTDGLIGAAQTGGVSDVTRMVFTLHLAISYSTGGRHRSLLFGGSFLC